MERLILLSPGGVTAEEVKVVLPGSANNDAHGGASGAQATGTLAERTEIFERETLLAEIRRHNFHMTNVAKALGLERSHLYKKCQQLGIDLQAMRKPS